MGSYLGLLTAMVCGVFASRGDLVLENLALRHQLAMCRRRPRVRNADRLLWGTCYAVGQAGERALWSCIQHGGALAS